MQQGINRERSGRHVGPSRNEGIYGLNIGPHHSHHHRRRVVRQVLVALSTITAIVVALLLISRLLA